MAEKVKLILARPERVAKEGYYAGVIIPAFADYLTVIPGRAPEHDMVAAGNGAIAE